MISAKGRIDLLDKPAVAIVGSHNCSAVGHAFARRIADQLSEAGLVIVSGLARGIDGAAHAAPLERGTVAVLAGGLDNIYPPEHADLHNEIAISGWSRNALRVSSHAARISRAATGSSQAWLLASSSWRRAASPAP